MTDGTDHLRSRSPFHLFRALSSSSIVVVDSYKLLKQCQRPLRISRNTSPARCRCRRDAIEDLAQWHYSQTPTTTVSDKQTEQKNKRIKRMKTKGRQQFDPNLFIASCSSFFFAFYHLFVALPLFDYSDCAPVKRD